MSAVTITSETPAARVQARQRLENLALAYQVGAVGPVLVAAELLRLRGLSLRDRFRWWRELCNAVDSYATARYGAPDWSRVPEDLRDPEEWLGWCRGRIDEALDALTGAPTYTVREQLERLAKWSLDGRVQDHCLPSILADLCPDVPAEQALLAFTSLVEAVLLRDDHGGGQQPVDEALDLLTEGAQ